MAAASGACLAHAVPYTRPDTQRRRCVLCCVRSLDNFAQHDDLAASFCDEVLCATVWEVSHHGSSWMDAVWWSNGLQACSSILLHPGSSPFACMCRPPRRLLLDRMARRCHSNDCQYNMLECDVARARKCGMFCIVHR